MNKKDTKYVIYIIIALLFYIGLVFLQFSMEDNELPYIGISILLFITSLLIGLSIQKIQSRQEFQEQLRSKAIGSIRRLQDIEILVKRGLTNIPDDTNNNSKTIFNVISDSVRSAKFDWIDVLEEDFKKIQELESKKLALIDALSHTNEDHEEGRKKIIDLKNEITKLQNSIPQTLYSSVTRTQLADMYTFKTQEFLNDIASNVNKYEILIEILDLKLYSIIEQHEPLILHYSYETKNNGLFIILGNDIDNKIGKVINKAKEYKISDVDYYTWLNSALYKYSSNDVKILNDYTYQIKTTENGDVISVEIPSYKLFLAVG